MRKEFKCFTQKKKTKTKTKTKQNKTKNPTCKRSQYVGNKGQKAICRKNSKIMEVTVPL